MRAFGHGLILRDLSQLAQMEARGEPTEGRLLMPQEEANDLFELALAASDNHGMFIAPADGKMYRASNIVDSTKDSERDRARLTDKGAETEVVSVWNSERSGTAQDGPVQKDDLGLTPDATPEEVLQAYGERLMQQPGQAFEGLVREVLAGSGASASVIAESLSRHPFVSAHAAYYYAHIGRHLKNGTLWARGDSYDRYYCVLSIAADVLVTSDTDLQRTCQLMPFRPFRVLSTQEFVENCT
jgi:hypothetical protein